jgi:methyl-accepting chemotaxis protein
MQFKSIQQKITFWGGLCLLVTAAVIVGNAVYYLRSLATEARIEAIEMAKVRVGEISEKIAGEIKAEIDVSLDAARTLAQTFSGIKDEENAVELGRDEVNSILKIILDRNPTFVGTYTCWEPNAFDGMDRGFMDTDGHDATGRFIPYWNRNEAGEIVVEALVDYEKEGDGDYYQLPKKTKIESIIDPYIYPVQGKPTMLTSLVVPIMTGETFHGIAGVDLTISFLQKLVDDVENLYDGSARIVIISNNGTLAAVTHEPDLAGKHMKEIHADWEEDLDYIQQGKTTVELDEGRLAAFVPLKAGLTTTPWSVNVLIPMGKITEKADHQMDDAVKDMWIMIVVSIVCTLTLLGLLWFVAGGIARPIRLTADALKDIAEGEGDLTIRLSEQNRDEVGDLSRWFNTFLEKLQTIIRDVAVNADTLNSSSGDLSTLSGQMSAEADNMSGKADSVASAAEEMSSNINSVAAAMEEATTNMNMVAAATEEMSASVSEIAQNSEKARGATDQAVAQVQKSSDQIEELGKAAQEIGKVTETITEISEQTNLLALNATIEAARAGEAGKGFAVVANEIKELAKQTADATQEIKQKISANQESTNRTVKDIGEISEVIKDVNEIVATIATAVEEQSVTTKEIAGNVAQGTQGLQEVNENVSQSSGVAGEIAKEIAEVNHSSGEISTSSSQVDMSSADLSRLAEQLKEMVGKFKV